MVGKKLGSAWTDSTEMNAGRSVAIMKPSEYLYRGLRNGMCFPPCGCFVWLLAGSHEMKNQDSYERGVMVAGTKDVMNEVGRRTQVAARTKA